MLLVNSGSDTVLDSMAFATVDELLLLCHTKAAPTDAEWERWIERERRGDHRALLISTEGGAPNSRQRARVAAVTQSRDGKRPPVALLTDSAVTRHVMTAFAWILGGDHPMKVFPRAAVAEAVAWCGADQSLERVRIALERLHGRLARAPRQPKP